MKEIDLSVKIGNVVLKSVMPASGTFGIESCEVCDRKLGAIVPKSVTLHQEMETRRPHCGDSWRDVKFCRIQNKGLQHFLDFIILL